MATQQEQAQQGIAPQPVQVKPLSRIEQLEQKVENIAKAVNLNLDRNAAAILADIQNEIRIIKAHLGL